MLILDILSDDNSRIALSLWLPLVAILIFLALYFKRRRIALFLLLSLPFIYFGAKWLDDQENIQNQKSNRKQREKYYRQDSLGKVQDTLHISKDSLKKEE